MPSADPHAFASAYREHLSWVLHTVRRLGVGASEQEDVAHDVFSTAWRKLDTYSPERPMRPWLFGIAFRIVSNRKSTRSGSETLDPELDARAGGAARPDEVLEGEVTRSHVLKALDGLPLEQRALFVGHDIEQTPINELAEQLAVPLNTAYSRLRLARQKFQTTFQSLQAGAPS
ncbi:MAG: sigma-70 family RNA polymerase sigma factor [Myxococcaceae bacterium]|nr:sigma-70 family RNA polymerase sigma factor [Myxococcaceae bacterium]